VSDDLLLCITLKQPWATWILWGWKLIETRTHNHFRSLVGKRIGIHAGLSMDRRAITLAAPYMTATQIRVSAGHQHVRGALLCTAFVSKFGIVPAVESERAMINCHVFRAGLWLRDVQPFTPPIPMRGHQGIWRRSYPLAA
jgi:hypothetical protein